MMKLLLTKTSIYDYLFCGLILAIPFSLKLPNILLIVLTLFFIIDFKNLKNIEFKSLYKIQYFILGTLILYWIIKGLLTGSISENKHNLMLPIVMFPLLILKVRDGYKLLFTIVLAGFIVGLRALYGIVLNYFSTNEILPFEGNSINQILGMERPYLGFLLIISIIIAAFLSLQFRKLRWFFRAYSLFAVIIIIVISARMSLLTLGCAVIVYYLFYLKIELKRKFIYISIFLVLLASFISFNKTLQNRLFISNNFQESVKSFQRFEPRFIIWPCSYDIVHSQVFDGVFGLESEKRVDELLQRCYLTKIESKDRAYFFAETDLNTHNQFIGTFLSSGSVGLLLLLLFFIIQLCCKIKNFYPTILGISLLLFFFVENVLYRQVGIYFFILTVVLMNSAELNFKDLDSKGRIK